MDKIFITGPIGAGKTTLAKQLAAQLGFPAIPLDSFVWKNGSERQSNDFVLSELKEQLAGKPQWIVEGCYPPCAYKAVMNQAALTVFLNYSLWACITGILARHDDRLPTLNAKLRLMQSAAYFHPRAVADLPKESADFIQGATEGRRRVRQWFDEAQKETHANCLILGSRRKTDNFISQLQSPLLHPRTILAR
jgi:adenylate kinase family enzyme